MNDAKEEKTPGQALADLVQKGIDIAVEKRCKNPIITIEIMTKEMQVPVQLKVEDWSIDLENGIDRGSFYIKPVGASPYQDKLHKLRWMHPVPSKPEPDIEQLPPAPSEEGEFQPLMEPESLEESKIELNETGDSWIPDSF